ncbi:DUF2934 domain-containing protein [Bradyrhizobium pachyrhizi]|uniref:DUF2934 domain-containing protein n=1 Tax=Bradyrhizobium pachyrhizi TaxID=280333 RepID=A0A844SVN2_9BRAD|nr:DUF2934 domain-containing protein [Bradyrhizobium pachyrhizi]MVT71028.1 DUF2934 domain-containing protein [Bradyrhizobium pachyrhizi]
MRTLTEQDIRTRAYKLWQAAGEPRSKFDAFWYQAEKELLKERTAQMRGSRRPDATKNVRQRRAVSTVN